MKVLVAGGLGFIGSHTCIELLNSGHEVVVADNLYNAKEEVRDRIEQIAGRPIDFYRVDCCDSSAMEALFDAHRFDAVIHFAGYKAVGESVANPLAYYENNLLSSLVLFKQMRDHGVSTLVFSSSATVYDPDNQSPLLEGMALRAINPYGRTKLMIEQILEDVTVADQTFKAILLRYFNPIGAHESGLIGESPVGIPNNLMPYICQVADGRRDKLSVFGDDYDTPDGTGVRDYIHVTDLARGHVKALEADLSPGLSVYNLGTGKGTSVLELLHAFEKANDLTIPYIITGRRPGDAATVFADCSKAERDLGWKAVLTIEDSCRSAWNYQMRTEMKIDEKVNQEK